MFGDVGVWTAQGREHHVPFHVHTKQAIAALIQGKLEAVRERPPAQSRTGISGSKCDTDQDAVLLADAQRVWGGRSSLNSLHYEKSNWTGISWATKL